MFDTKFENVQPLKRKTHEHLTLTDHIEGQDLQLKGFMKVYLNVKYDRFFINRVPAMVINANLNLNLKLEMFKAKVTENGRNG